MRMIDDCPMKKSWFLQKLQRNKKAPEGVYARCVGVSKYYVEWHWKVEQCINRKCQGHPTSIFGKYLFERRFEI